MVVLLVNINRYGGNGLKRFPVQPFWPSRSQQLVHFQANTPSDELMTKTRSLPAQQVILAKMVLDMELGQPILWQGNTEMTAIDLLARIRKQELALQANGYPSTFHNLSNWVLSGSGLIFLAPEDVFLGMVFLANRGLLKISYDSSADKNVPEHQRVEEITVTTYGDEVLNNVPRTLIESDYQERSALRKKADLQTKLALVEHNAQQKQSLIPLLLYPHPVTGYSGWQFLKRFNATLNEMGWMSKLMTGKEILTWPQLKKAMDPSSRLDFQILQEQVLGLMKLGALEFVQNRKSARSYIKLKPGLKAALDSSNSEPMKTFNLDVSHIRGWFQSAQKQSKDQVVKREQHLIQMEKEATASRLNFEALKRSYQSILKALKEQSGVGSIETDLLPLLQQAESLKGRVLMEEDVQKGLERWMNSLRFQFAEWQLALESNLAQRDRLMIGLEGAERINQPQQLVSQLMLLFEADNKAHDALDSTLNQMLKEAIKKTGPTDWRLSVKNPLNQSADRLSIQSRTALLLADYRPEAETVNPQTGNGPVKPAENQSTPKPSTPPAYTQFYGDETEKDI
jgi:hypothetical protein